MNDCRGYSTAKVVVPKCDAYQDQDGTVESLATRCLSASCCINDCRDYSMAKVVVPNLPTANVVVGRTESEDSGRQEMQQC